jgi:hypothetical protein
MNRVPAAGGRIVGQANRLLPLFAVLAQAAGAEAGAAMVISACDRPCRFAYLTWPGANVYCRA